MVLRVASSGSHCGQKVISLNLIVVVESKGCSGEVPMEPGSPVCLTQEIGTERLALRATRAATSAICNFNQA